MRFYAVHMYVCWYVLVCVYVLVYVKVGVCLRVLTPSPGHTWSCLENLGLD